MTTVLAQQTVGPTQMSSFARNLPPAFVENRGQWDTPAAFVMRSGDFIARVEWDAIVLQLARAIDTELVSTAVARLVFEGSSLRVETCGVDPLPGLHHFFLGSDPRCWRTGVPGFASVNCANLYEGIDLAIGWREGQLEYDLILDPGADLSHVIVRCDGLDGFEIMPDGSMALRTALGDIVQSAPTTWEVLPDGQRRLVRCTPKRIDEYRFRFEVEGRAADLPLVIDPGLAWATFVGGSAVDVPSDLVVLDDGSVLMSGATQSPDFPSTPGAYTLPGNGSHDCILARLDSTGSQLEFATHFGGSGFESATWVAVAPDGRMTIAGATSSTDLPTTSMAFDKTFSSILNTADAFVARLDPTGSVLEYSTYLGGELGEVPGGLALEQDGGAVVVGRTCSSQFPITPGAYDGSLAGTCGCYATRLDPTGSSLVFSTFLDGADSDEQAQGVDVTDDGRIVVAGYTRSADWPTTPGVYQASMPAGVGQGFITMLSADGSLMASTFLGADGGTASVGQVRATSLQDLALAMSCTSPNFPLTPHGWISQIDPTATSIVARMDMDLTRLIVAVPLGGSSIDYSEDMAVAADGSVTVVGRTHSFDYPTTSGALDTTFSFGCADGFVSKIDATGTQLLYSTYVGEFSDFCSDTVAVALDSSGGTYVMHKPGTAAYPTTPGSFGEDNHGGSDLYLMRLVVADPVWTTIGAGLTGSAGVPELFGAGSLTIGAPVSIELASALPNSPALLVIGLSEASLALKGGVLLPAPDVVVPLALGPQGSLELEAAWPAGVPPGIALYLQGWIADPAGPKGFAASPALVVVTP